tara:strand:- start:6806 stop:6985 length:180 start_codon:yes stop_codon:yes gene_type:complete
MAKRKYVSTLEVIIHVHHDDKYGEDIDDNEIVKQLKQVTRDVDDYGYKAWMEVIYTEET